MKINNKFLSAVLNEPVCSFSEIHLDCSEDYIIYHSQPNNPKSINKYKLMHEIKLWSLSNGCELNSGLFLFEEMEDRFTYKSKVMGFCFIPNVIKSVTERHLVIGYPESEMIATFKDKQFEANTEFEAVVKAGEWLYETIRRNRTNKVC